MAFNQNPYGEHEWDFYFQNHTVQRSIVLAVKRLGLAYCVSCWRVRVSLLC